MSNHTTLTLKDKLHRKTKPPPADSVTFSRGARLAPPAPPKPLVSPARLAADKYFDPTVDLRLYWFLWELGERAPKRRHPTLESALGELARLQSLNPKKRFGVYRAVLVAGVKP
jgi:hypothetical protein